MSELGGAIIRMRWEGVVGWLLGPALLLLGVGLKEAYSPSHFGGCEDD